MSAGRLVYDACFTAGLRNYRPELGPAFRPARIAYSVTMTEVSEVRRSFVVDITEHFETKMRAILAFASQFTQPAGGDAVALPFDGFRDAVEQAARRQGQTVGCRYGEAFVLREPLELSGVSELWRASD